MKNKCDNCGYRFKNDDEVICPECLSARDNDIDCNNLHSHEENASFTNSSQPQYNYGYEPASAEKKKGKSGCLIAFFVTIAVILAVVALPILLMIFDEMDAGGAEEEIAAITVSYGEELQIKDFTVKFSEPYIVDPAEIPEDYPLQEEHRLWAIDVTLSDAQSKYTSFDLYSMRLRTDEIPPEDDYYSTDWTAISYNGLFDDQAPSYIRIIQGTTIEKTMYYEVPDVFSEVYFTAENHEYTDDGTIKTLYKFS